MSEDFDLDKWRKKNPMDYLLAMDLIKLSTNKEEIFKEIYKVTRLHLPDVLFKYYSLTDNVQLNDIKLQTLSDCQVFLSEPKYLNDPFDGKAYFYRPEELAKFGRLAHYGGKLIDDFTAHIRVTALTANGVNSMPMWAHYAGNHSGYCISYDMKQNTQLSACTFPVQYTDTRIDVTDLMVSQVKRMMQEIETQSMAGEKAIKLSDLSLVYMESYFCNLKHTTWSYEKEFRCTIGATASDSSYASAFPKAIYMGMKCSEANKERLMQIASTLSVPIYQMVFDECSTDFNLLANRIAGVGA